MVIICILEMRKLKPTEIDNLVRVKGSQESK
jgi:hypothetical protein